MLMDYVIAIKNFLNTEGHQNRASGLKVTAILLKGWISPIGGVALGRVCACSLCSWLVFTEYCRILAQFVGDSQVYKMGIK